MFRDPFVGSCAVSLARHYVPSLLRPLDPKEDWRARLGSIFLTSAFTCAATLFPLNWLAKKVMPSSTLSVAARGIFAFYCLASSTCHLYFEMHNKAQKKDEKLERILEELKNDNYSTLLKHPSLIDPLKSYLSLDKQKALFHGIIDPVNEKIKPEAKIVILRNLIVGGVLVPALVRNAEEETKVFKLWLTVKDEGFLDLLTDNFDINAPYVGSEQGVYRKYRNPLEVALEHMMLCNPYQKEDITTVCLLLQLGAKTKVDAFFTQLEIVEADRTFREHYPLLFRTLTHACATKEKHPQLFISEKALQGDASLVSDDNLRKITTSGLSFWDVLLTDFETLGASDCGAGLKGAIPSRLTHATRFLTLFDPRELFCFLLRTLKATTLSVEHRKLLVECFKEVIVNCTLSQQVACFLEMRDPLIGDLLLEIFGNAALINPLSPSILSTLAFSLSTDARFTNYSKLQHFQYFIDKGAVIREADKRTVRETLKEQKDGGAEILELCQTHGLLYSSLALNTNALRQHPPAVF